MMFIKKFLIKINRKYKRILLFLYKLIKNRLFQKIFLIFILTFSTILSIILLFLGLEVYPHTWFFSPKIVGFLTIPCFFISISFYFLNNLDLFDLFCEKIFNIFIKPWFLLIIVFLFCFGVFFLYSILNLPGFIFFIAIIPILPIYIFSIIFINYKSPTGVGAAKWLGFFSFIVLIPLLIYCFHLIGKRIFSKINITNDDNHELYHNTIDYVRNKPERNKNTFYKELFILWLVSIIFYFLTLFYSNLAYDTPLYLTFVKDFFDSGDLNLILNPTLKSKPRRSYSIIINISFLIPVLLLIFFTIICGGDLFLGAVVLITLLFCIGPPLIALITKNITESSSIAIWAGILYFLFANILFKLVGVLKQHITLDLILILLYLITKKYKSNFKKNISILLVFVIFIIQSLLYNLLLGILYLILTQHFLRKKTVNFGGLKDPEIYRRIKLLTIFLVGGFLLLIFFNGYLSHMIYLFLNKSISLSPTGRKIFQPSLSDILNSTILLLQLGIGSIFMIIGIYIDYKKKIIKNFKMRSFLIIFLECSIIFLFMNLFNFNLYPERLILFIPIGMSIFGAIGIVELRRIFPKILKKSPKFQRLVELSLISTLLMSCFLTTIHVRNGYINQLELDAIDWLKTRPDYDKLTNKNTTDIQIISNEHLRWWIQYRIHYNAYSQNYGLTSIANWISNTTFAEKLKKNAHEKLYIFISKSTDQFSENFTIRGLIKFFNEYREDYPFIWTKYKINDLVIIWEIEYI